MQVLWIVLIRVGNPNRIRAREISLFPFLRPPKLKEIVTFSKQEEEKSYER